MKETLLTRSALSAVLSLSPKGSKQFEPPSTAVLILPQYPNTLLMTGVMKKCLGIIAARVALSQTIPHGVIIAGAVSAGLKCNSG